MKTNSDFSKDSTKAVSLASVFQKYINNQNDNRDSMKLENQLVQIIAYIEDRFKQFSDNVVGIRNDLFISSTLSQQNHLLNQYMSESQQCNHKMSELIKTVNINDISSPNWENEMKKKIQTLSRDNQIV